MFLQRETVNSWKRNMNKSRASRNPKKLPLPRSIYVSEANGSISSEAKSQSSIISVKISNERDAENVVIEWYRNNKPFNNRLQPGLNMSKRQSAGGGGGGCRSVEIKRSFPCLKCKQLNRTCECAKFRNMYRKIYGPTTDETILVGMETLHNLVSSRCSDSQTSVRAMEGTVRQQREYLAESGAPRNTKPSDYNYNRDNNRNGNNGGRGRMPRDQYNDRPKDKYRDYPSGSELEANIELLELNKNQSQSRKWNDATGRRDGRKSKGNDNGRNGNKTWDENNENARRKEVSLKQACYEDDDTASAYSDISKFVSSDGITNAYHSDASRLSLESRYTVEHSVSSVDSKVTAQNPSPLVSDYSNEILADSTEHADTVLTDTETNNAVAISKHSLSDSPIETDNGTNDAEEIAQNIVNEQIALAQEQDHIIKRSSNNVEHSSVHRCINELVQQVPSASKHHRDQQNNVPEQEQIHHEPDTTSSDETKGDTAEDTDSTEYLKPSTPLYTCLVNPIKNVKTIPVITRFVVPVWDRDKPYPTVHFISSVKDLTSMRADVQKPCPERSKKHRDLVEYLLNPMRYLNSISNKENDSIRRSKSDSSLSVSSVHSTTRLFSEATTNMIQQDNLCLTKDELNSICSRDEQSGSRIYIYDTGQTYLPTPEPMFGKQNNIGEELYYLRQEKNDKATSESVKIDSMSNPVESFSRETSDDEHNDMSLSSSSSNICTNSITDENNVPQYITQDSAESSNDVTNTDDTVQNQRKNEIYIQSEQGHNIIDDTSTSPSNTSMKLKDNDGTITEEGILSLSSLQSSCISKVYTSTSYTDTSNSEYNTELLRELNAIANDKTEKQVLTPIQEETESSDTESSCTENKSSLEQHAVTPKLSTNHVKVENDNIVQINLVQNEAKLSTHDTLAMDKSLMKQENNDKMEENIDISETSPETVSRTDEIITIKQAPNNVDFASSVYSPVPTTCSCFTICRGGADDDDTKTGKKIELNDKQINTRPVRLKRESKSQQTDPVKLRSIKSKGETSSGWTASTRTSSVSTDTVPVRRTKRRSTGTMSKSRKSSTTTKSVKFERKSSKEDAFAEEVSSECLDSVTADEGKFKATMSDDQNMGDQAKSEQKLPNRNLQARETRYAIARITKYDEFTTYEILKSTRAKPRIIPQTTEGVFTVRNRKKRKLKL